MLDSDAQAPGLPWPSLPVSFRVGSVGAGIGVGCGVGIGFGQALALGGVPVLGQAAQGVGYGVSQFAPITQAGDALRSAVRRLGVRGLDAGLGCGVGVGYGFGAGLFLQPAAAEQLVQGVERAAGSLAAQVQSRLQSAGLQPPPASSPTPAGNALAAAPAHTRGPALVQNQAALQPAVWGQLGPSPLGLHGQPGLQAGSALTAAARLQEGGGDGEGVVAVAGTPSAPAAAPSAAQAGAATPEELRALLRHERQIARLKAQNRALRRAVCKLDKRLPLCQEPSDSGSGG